MTVEERIEKVKAQISSFDNKASILIAVLGVFFAISLVAIDAIFSAEILSESDVERCLLIGVALLIASFLVLATITFILLVAVIYPRKKPKAKRASASYYWDIAKMSKEELASCIALEEKEDLIEQLSINAKICTKKHKFLVSAIWSTLPLFIVVVAMFVVSMFYC